MRESLALYREPPAQPDWAEAVKSVREATPAELPPGYPYGLRFVVPMVEMPKYLPWLIEQFARRGGQLQQRRVGSLAELADEYTDAVVNCSGIASRNLVGDATVYPVRGQIVRVTNPGLSMSVRDEHHPAGRAYVHPRSEDCILGGTLELNNWDTTIDLATSAAIIERCREIVARRSLGRSGRRDHVDHAARQRQRWDQGPTTCFCLAVRRNYLAFAGLPPKVVAWRRANFETN
jgi:D-amino-acid oxidase